MCHLTGWTWDYVENTLTVERLHALHKEWKCNPPLTLMIKAFMGIKNSPATPLAEPKAPGFLTRSIEE